MNARWIGVGCGCLMLTGLPRAQAGGSGLNVAVVINQSSTNSIQLGNYYCEKRQVPPQNVLRTSWTGSLTDWTEAEFETVIRNPLIAMLAARQLTNQIDYIVVSMDFPYRISQTTSLTSWNSTSSVLFYGFKMDDPEDPAYCSLPAISANSYAFSEAVFRQAPPDTAATTSFLAMMITSSNLAQAKAIVDRGVASDGVFPTQTVLLAHSSDVLRNIRYWAFDDAIFNARLRGNYSMQATNTDIAFGLSNLLGYETGLSGFAITPNTFVPGAMADSLTSNGGRIFEDAGQTTLLAFLDAGATASYGTVVEPCAWPQKFPSPQNYFYQARGFSLAESYFQSLANPHQGLLVGEPLAAPFARPPAILWSNLPPNALLAGTTNLALQVTASDAQHPVEQVDLFLDGVFLQTVTNLAPQPNNLLYVSLNGVVTNYAVSAGENLQSIASNLTAQLNQPGYSIGTRISAYAYGDRIELQSSVIARTGTQTPVVVSNSIGAGATLTTFISGRTNLLDSSARGLRSYYVTNAPQAGDFLQLIVVKTNGTTVTVSVTNNSGWTMAQMGKALFDGVNTNVVLQASDGLDVEDIVMHEDYFDPNDHAGDFNIRARSPGWRESQLQVRLRGSAAFGIQPAGTNRLDENVTDLKPRGHLYVTAGATNLPVGFAFNTASLADGYHELTAVAYEGSHVRTQKRSAQTVRILNNSLSATFTSLFGGSNTALGVTLQFAVVANTNNIAKIELFSTGGSVASVTGLSNALFSVASTNLGLGLHLFYAVVSGTDGKQYRTETKWIRLIGAEVPFPLSVSAGPVTLAWPATAGRGYEILSATNPTKPFLIRASLTPSNSGARWTEPNPAVPYQFYRVRSTN